MRNKSGSSAFEDDERAEALAALARRQGTDLIEDHLSHHLNQNPDSSYVTWIATLHPENAQVTVDQRFFVPGNPWWTVYEGAKSEIPIATATAVADATTTDLEEQAPPASKQPNVYVPPANQKKSCTAISPLAAFVGFNLALMAILAVVSLEAFAFVVYIFSVGFFRLAKVMDPPNIWTGILHSTCVFCYWSLALVDSSLLLSSVITTEFVAASAYVTCAILGGCDLAAGWHQYTRKTCHLIRWAFRSKFEYPPRRFCGLVQVKEEDDEKPSAGSSGTMNGSSTTSNPPPSAPLTNSNVVAVAECKGTLMDQHFTGTDSYFKDSSAV